MQILLLGGTGYLGGNIACRLAEEGYELTCTVRNTSDTSRIVGKNINIISSDISEVEVFLKHTQVDWVINSVCTYKANNTLYGDLLSSNLLFPLSVLNSAVKNNVRNYITIGTSLPDYLNMYSFAKSRFGQFGEYLSRTDGINFADLRLEMFYGGHDEPDNRFLSSCKRKMLNNETIKLTEGTQKRDLIRVEDVVGVIVKLIASDYLNGYMALPVGSGEQHQIKEILQFLKEKLNSESQLLFGAIPYRTGEPNTIANIEWYKDLGYSLQWDYFSGLEMYANQLGQ